MTDVEQVLVVIGALAVLVGVFFVITKIINFLMRPRLDIDRLDGRVDKLTKEVELMKRSDDEFRDRLGGRVDNLTKEVELMKMSDDELRDLFFGNKSRLRPLREVYFLQVVAEMQRRDILLTKEETERVVEEMRRDRGEKWGRFCSHI